MSIGGHCPGFHSGGVAGCRWPFAVLAAVATVSEWARHFLIRGLSAAGSSVPIMRWNEFRSMCPELAGIAQRRLEERYLCLIGTLRQDGWPRISPVEPFIVDGELMMGMMKGSRKARGSAA